MSVIGSQAFDRLVGDIPVVRRASEATFVFGVTMRLASFSAEVPVWVVGKPWVLVVPVLPDGGRHLPLLLSRTEMERMGVVVNVWVRSWVVPTQFKEAPGTRHLILPVRMRRGQSRGESGERQVMAVQQAHRRPVSILEDIRLGGKALGEKTAIPAVVEVPPVEQPREPRREDPGLEKAMRALHVRWGHSSVDTAVRTLRDRKEF